jgi:hypothetical protein
MENVTGSVRNYALDNIEPVGGRAWLSDFYDTYGVTDPSALQIGIFRCRSGQITCAEAYVAKSAAVARTKVFGGPG